MIPLIERELVERKRWINSQEFFDIICIAQSAPGAVAVNTAVLTGARMYGTAGAFVAGLGVMLPSFLVMLVIAATFHHLMDVAAVKAVFRGIRPVVVALILYAAYKLSRTVESTVYNIGLGILALFLLAIVGIHPIYALLGAAVCGLVRAVLI